MSKIEKNKHQVIITLVELLSIFTAPLFICIAIYFDSRVFFVYLYLSIYIHIYTLDIN